MKLFKNKNIRTEFLPSAIEIVEAPASPLGKFSIWVIFLVVLVAILWSIFSKVDEVAIARGKVIPSGNTNIVQSLTGGVIKSIDIKEGQDVKKGDTLLTIDDSIIKSERDKLQSELEILNTSKDILQAYKDGKTPDINEEKLKSSRELVNEQLGYSKTINNMYSNQMENLNIDIKQAREDLGKTQARLQEARNNLAKATKELEDLKKAQVKANDKKLDMQEKQDNIELYNDQIKSITESINTKNDNIKIKENNKENQKLQNRQELEKELVNVLKLVESHKKDIEKLDKQIKELTIESPVEGKIQQLAVNTIGGVVQAGAPIVHIVPKNKELIVETMILNKDIGFISEGQKAQVKFDTFDFQRYGTIEGTITKITPDAVIVDNQSMYKASVKLKQKDININGKNLKFSPGMTVTCEIDTGKRRIIDFFIPGIKDVKNSFRLR
ncbi:HlyD family type I secretion periplasmic adaptor subunit [Clostridium sp. Marseille-Q2269]|uniref:HlyD family type I secretion periplasmic adaptor subunit n=1 Tax=Clostridium sp. Marseille-Q2269 TaxID=2942205 RepID=UPI002073C7BB|nr:HlyD family type I secretion periplasmic adaptor subunit [Clostridium sp. Marseille-Q2269]